MKRIIAGVVALSAGVTLADLTPPMLPSVKDGSVKMTQDTATGVATIEYEIEAMPAITTFDVLTNGVSIGDAAINCLVGDINREVKDGKKLTFTWRPDKSFPGHLFTEGNVKAVVKAWPTNDPPDYIVFFLDEPQAVRYYTSAAALPDGGLANSDYRNTRLVMRKIPASLATYKMGSPSGETGREPHKMKETLHDVTLTQDFYLGIYELTDNQYALLTGGTGSASDGLPCCSPTFNTMRGTDKYWPEDKHEVDEDCAIDKMRVKFGGRFQFDLPTEAQWEFACRAGCTTALYTGKNLTVTTGRDANLDPIAWYVGNRDNIPTRVGQLEPNKFGLYDMLGNAEEFCLDQTPSWEDPNDLGSDPVTDPVGYATEKTTHAVCRGGDCWSAPTYSRCAFRFPRDKAATANYFGFRLCITLP